MTNTVFVGGLPTTDEIPSSLRVLLDQFGAITAMTVKGPYAFVEFTEASAAERAVSSLHEMLFKGSKITVALAKGGPKEKKTPTSTPAKAKATPKSGQKSSGSDKKKNATPSLRAGVGHSSRSFGGPRRIPSPSHTPSYLDVSQWTPPPGGSRSLSTSGSRSRSPPSRFRSAFRSRSRSPRRMDDSPPRGFFRRSRSRSPDYTRGVIGRRSSSPADHSIEWSISSRSSESRSRSPSPDKNYRRRSRSPAYRRRSPPRESYKRPRSYSRSRSPSPHPHKRTKYDPAGDDLAIQLFDVLQGTSVQDISSIFNQVLQVAGQPKTDSVTNVTLDGTTAFIELKSKQLVKQCLEEIKQVALFGNMMRIGEAVMDMDLDLNEVSSLRKQTSQRNDSEFLRYSSLEDFLESVNRYRANVFDHHNKELQFRVELRIIGPKSEVEEAKQYLDRGPQL